VRIGGEFSRAKLKMRLHRRLWHRQLLTSACHHSPRAHSRSGTHPR
jgi:hypothetical protein